ncbi:FAD-dependent oxidoreductase [Termitidicoccus mucosus]|uniref:FAD-dependent oxidoreductase n=1 Tax=Termitidicoccus mucosus TaxID=1184151 RepID=UPI000838759D
MICFRKPILRILLALLSSFGAKVIAAPAPRPVERDIVIYGASSAGIAAAVQAVRMGKSVIVVEPGDRIGGLTTGGLGQTDIGNKHAIGGISLEFYKAVHKHYNDPASWQWQGPDTYKSHGQSGTAREEAAMWTFEPSVALKIFEQWVRRDGIEIIKGERLDRRNGVVKNGPRIAGFRTESGREFRGKIFIDATYEGDLMALAGVSYAVGREANALYDETLNGVQTRNARGHNLRPGIDPHVRKGDPSSGLLPFIDPAGPGEEGAGDRRVQAYCFRMCLTDHPDNRVPFAKPDGYREDWYELLFRNYEAGQQGVPWINSPMPNRKTDTNNRAGFSTDFIGQNYDYPEADYKTREEIVRRHLLYQQGLMWTLANHPRVPEDVRAQVAKWGVTKDEFAETGGWPGQLYIREARRMAGALVMTQHHCQGRETVDDSIGMAAYTMDSHNTQRYVDANGHVRNEGNVEVKGFPPYPVSYRALIPREGECENLIVPVCMSASHIAYGSIRMEPVFMIFGQSAATAAAIAMDDGVAVQKVDYNKLRERLLKDGQVLSGNKTINKPAAQGAGLEASVNALKERGIIREASYWMANARAGKKCAGDYVEILIINAVSRKKPVSTLDEACDYLHSAGLMDRPGDWKKYARKGKSCRGESVAGLIAGLDALTKPKE